MGRRGGGGGGGPVNTSVVSRTAILACHSCVLLLKVQNYQQWTFNEMLAVCKEKNHRIELGGGGGESQCPPPLCKKHF